LEKRPRRGLLAGLWQFPNVPEKMETQEALKALNQMGLRPKEILRQVEKSHIFTHIRWEMRGYYICVSQMNAEFTWLPAEELEAQAALPTAFRQFWEANLDI
jgi:A/G-specific adenine glycosylase